MSDADRVARPEGEPRRGGLSAGCWPSACRCSSSSWSLASSCRAAGAVAAQSRQRPQSVELSGAVRLGADGGHPDARFRSVAGHQRLRRQRRERAGDDRPGGRRRAGLSSLSSAGLAAGLGFGSLVGLFNGAFVSWLGINPFVVTLGSLNICLGLATTISGGRPVFNVPDAFSRLLYNGGSSPAFRPADAGGRRLPAAVFPARSHDVRPLALSDRQQSARGPSRGPAEQALSGARLYSLRAAGRFRRADADGADRAPASPISAAA